ncbi:MAG: hypothetical protein PUD91_00650 [Bacteroidales bacterium]|nr:hypothetical protein [Bacteroidales bacterium]
MKKLGFSAIFVAIMVAISSLCGYAQTFNSSATKVDYTKLLTKKEKKAAEKEAKKLEKAGWSVPMGAMAMELQIMRATCFAKEVTPQGEAKYAIGHSTTAGESYNAARLQALEMARVDAAQQLETELAGEMTTSFGNEEGAEIASLVSSAGGFRSLVSQKLSQSITVTEIQREQSGLKEVQVSVAVDREQVKKAAKNAIREKLRERGSKIIEKNGWE